MVKLRELRIEDMPTILRWRHECIDTLRTSSFLTLEQQEQWYKDVVCNRSANARFWGIDKVLADGRVEAFIGYCGIENIQWENSIGEISLLIDPIMHNKGLGKKAFDCILEFGFNRLNLHTLFAECYESNMAVHFWRGRFIGIDGTETVLPNRKYLNGKYINSVYFSVSRA